MNRYARPYLESMEALVKSQDAEIAALKREREAARLLIAGLERENDLAAALISAHESMGRLYTAVLDRTAVKIDKDCERIQALGGLCVVLLAALAGKGR